VAELTERQWQKMRAMDFTDVFWCKASSYARKSALKAVGIQWCDAVTRNACDKFDTDWDMKVFETPMKRARGNTEDSLVEDEEDADEHDDGNAGGDDSEDGGHDSEGETAVAEIADTYQ
jgi:hypothetical protein